MAIRAYAGYSASADIAECTNTQLQTSIMRLMCLRWNNYIKEDIVPSHIVQVMDEQIPKDCRVFCLWLKRNGYEEVSKALLPIIDNDDFLAARLVLSTAAKKFEEIIFL